MTTNIEYFRPRDIAEFAGWSEKTLANWRCEGAGPPFIKVGARVLYPKVDFLRWLKEKHREQRHAKAAKRAVA